MKNLVILTLVSATTFSHADILFTVTAGANVWHAKPSGHVDGVSLDQKGLNIDDENKLNIFAIFEQPIPFIPNIKVANTNLDLTGKTEASFTFQGQPFTAGATTSLDLSHTDLTLFWGVPLPLPYLDINFGLTARNFNGGAEVTGESGGVSINEKEALKQTVPLLYGQVKVGSFFGLYGYADMNYIDYDNNTISDLAFALGYTLPIPVIDLNIEAGHRQMNIKGKINDFSSDIKVGGIFAGINLAFGF